MPTSAIRKKWTPLYRLDKPGLSEICKTSSGTAHRGFYGTRLTARPRWKNRFRRFTKNVSLFDTDGTMDFQNASTRF